MKVAVVQTPCGDLTLLEGEAGLEVATFETIELPPDAQHDSNMAAATQLREYFAGDRKTFDLELNAAGTPFQKEVWARLVAIPFGETTTYGALAARMGRPSASRAVGAANGRNPIAVIVPCHRVVGANGALTGYAGGLERKQVLLHHEQGAPLTLFSI